MSVEKLNDCIAAIETKFNIVVTHISASAQKAFSFRFNVGDRDYSVEYNEEFNDYLLTDHLGSTRQVHTSIEQVVEALVETRQALLAAVLTMKSMKRDEVIKVRREIEGEGIGNPRLNSLCDRLGGVEREIQDLTNSYDLNQAAIK